MPEPIALSTATSPGPVITGAVTAPPAPPGLADDPLTTVTWHDVELLAVGTWNASTGPAPIDEAMLQCILEASRDPNVDQAVVHPGHFDPRFPQQTDGEPILGTVRPTRIETRGGRTVLLGDVSGIPPKVASVLRQAYPRRSVELALGLKTAAGRTYKVALTGLGLLGVQTPAVKGLADIVARYAAQSAPDGGSLTTLTAGDTPTAGGGLPTASPLGLHDGASPTPTQGAPKMPRPRTDAELREFLELAADADVAALQASITGIGTPPVVTPPVVTPPVVTAPVVTAPVVTPPAVTEPVVTAPVAATPEAIAAAAAQLTASLAAGTTLPNGMVVMDPAVMATLTSAAGDITTTRRDNVITSALTAGRLTPHEAFGADGKGGFRAQLNVDEASTTALIQALSAGRVPLAERGTGRETASGVHLSAGEIDTKVWDEFEAGMFGDDLGRTAPPA